MKKFLRLILFFIASISCILVLSSQYSAETEEVLSHDEIEQIKTQVIASIENHIEVLMSLDYEEAMKFYTKDDYIVFGDGKYWGDYNKIDEIWGYCLPRWQAITKWDLTNQKVHVFSKNSVIAYVEWDHARINEDGSDTKAYGF